MVLVTCAIVGLLLGVLVGFLIPPRSKEIDVDLTALFPPAKHTLLGHRE